MISSDIELVQLKDIQHISVQVTQKINEKYLNDFLNTTLSSHQIKLQDNSKVFTQFIKEANTYEIYIVNNKNKIILEQQIFKAFYIQNKLDSSTYDLFITLKYFIIYKNNNFYFSKENKSYKKEDFINYLSVTYKIDIENSYEICSEQLLMLKDNFYTFFDDNIIMKEISFKSKNKYKYYFLYLFILLSIFMYLMYNDCSNKNTKILSQQEIKLEIIKNKYLKLLKNVKNTKGNQEDALTQKIIKIFYYLKKHKLNVVSFDYNKKFYMLLSSHNKNKLYRFVDEFKDKSKVKHIKKVSDTKNYEMLVEIEF